MIQQRFFGLWRNVKDYVLIFFGLILYSFGWTCFLLPLGVTTGGITGFSAFIFYATGIPIGATYFTLNVILLLIAIKILGFQFCIRTIFGVFGMSALLSFFQMVIKEPVIQDEPFMSCVIGGMLCGTALGIVFTSNGSTGGTDIIAAIVNKYRNISLGRGILYCDILITTLSYIVFHDISKVVFGLVTMIITTYMCDLVINGARRSVQFLIFSEKYPEIATRINKDLHRGVTVLDGMGWYSKNSKKVLVVLAKRYESVTIFRIIKEIDPQAFISQANVVGVYGEGFDKIK